jgi:hypothetical protein
VSLPVVLGLAPRAREAVGVVPHRLDVLGEHRGELGAFTDGVLHEGPHTLDMCTAADLLRLSMPPG